MDILRYIRIERSKQTENESVQIGCYRSLWQYQTALPFVLDMCVECVVMILGVTQAYMW